MTQSALNADPKCVWITGASSGLGAALAHEYAASGVDVLATARPGARLDALVQQLGARASALPADLTDRRALDNLFASLDGNAQLPDVAILNAGTYLPMGMKTLDGDACRDLFALNFFSTIDTLERLLPRFADRGHGHIALVGSVAADLGLPYAGPYAASKAALHRLWQSLLPELEREGIRLSLIEPGFVRTPLTDKNDFPMPFIVDADEAAALIRRRLDAGARRIRFPFAMSLIMRLLGNLPDALSLSLRRRMLRE